MSEDGMSAKDRLQVLQAALEERGARDVKFFFNLGSDTQLTKVVSDVADVLDAVIAGRTVPMPLLGDSVRK
jgi:hypothetical protein